MKKILLCFCLGAFLLSCNSESDKEKTESSDTMKSSDSKPAVDLPYKASYTSNFSTDVSDADLKMVLMSYKDWETGNLEGLGKAMADTVVVDMSSGEHLKLDNAALMKRWGNSRDSLSSVRIDMAGWQKMYATDKKEAYVVTWYDEWDTYKNGKVDSATFHDINQVKDGKIIWYSQYRRPKK